MSLQEEPSSPFEFKSWTPEATPKESRARNIERLRKSAQVSLFNLSRTSSYPPGLKTIDNSPNEKESVLEHSRTPKTHRRFTSLDNNVVNKFGSDNKIDKKSGLEMTVKGDGDDLFLEKDEIKKVDSIRSLKSLSIHEDSKIEIHQTKEHQILNIPLDSNNNLEIQEFYNLENGENLSLSPLSGKQHSIFLSNSRNEEQELREDLQVENDPDIHFIQGNFSSYYQEGEILGEGTSGIVKKCTKNATNEIFAVKIVRYRGDTERLFLEVNEFRNHRKLHHRNIIKVYELYIDYFTKKTYLIMEMVESQEMLQVINEFGHFDEIVASKIFKQILSGINYLHLNGVCHRDLKPSNILVSKDGEIVKITDFNVSKFSDRKDYTAISIQNYKMWTQTGTIAFTAPEVFTDSQYTSEHFVREAVDLWSTGVILYTMLCGYQPFQADSVQELIELIKEAKYEFHVDPWDSISSEAKDLIKGLMNPDLKKRYSPFQALTHSWIENQGQPRNKHLRISVDNFWSYLEESPKNQKPHPVKAMAGSSFYLAYQSAISRIGDQNHQAINCELQPCRKDFLNSTFCNIFPISKINLSVTRARENLMEIDFNEKVKSKPNIPRIPHFNTQEELPFIFVPVTVEFERTKYCN